jgi:hypothetical protein
MFYGQRPSNVPMPDTPAEHASQDAKDQIAAAASPTIEATGPGVPTSSRRALSEIRRELLPEELSSPGAQKLLLEMLDRTESECEAARGYIELYHAANTRAAVLEEKVRRRNAFEVLFSISLAVGGVLVGLWPSWGLGSAAIGGVLIVVSAIAKMVFNK